MSQKRQLPETLKTPSGRLVKLVEAKVGKVEAMTLSREGVEALRRQRREKR